MGARGTPPALACGAIRHSPLPQARSQACTQSAAGPEPAPKSSAPVDAWLARGLLACRSNRGHRCQALSPRREPRELSGNRKGAAGQKWAPRAPRWSPGW